MYAEGRPDAYGGPDALYDVRLHGAAMGVAKIMTDFAEEVYRHFRLECGDVAGEKEAFEKHVAPYLKEPPQQERDEQACRDWYRRLSGVCSYRDSWLAALKWERDRVK